MWNKRKLLVVLCAILLVAVPACPRKTSGPADDSSAAASQTGDQFSGNGDATGIESEPQERIPAPGASLKIGTPFPMFVARDLNGKMLDLSALLSPNGYVLVWFWATWTDPDARDLTTLAPLYVAKEGQRFHFVTVNLDLPEKAERISQIVKERLFQFPVVADFAQSAPGSLAEAYGFGPGKSTGNFLIGPDGTILLTNLKATEAEGIIDKLLADESVYRPVQISIQVSQEIHPVLSDEPVATGQDGNGLKVPESLLLSASIVNPDALQSDYYEAKIVYRILKPSGDTTCLRVYPAEPDSPLISGPDGRPVEFTVMTGDYRELSSSVQGQMPQFMTDVPLPRDAAVVEFWGETWSFFLDRTVTGDRGKQDFARVPYCTPEAVERQGGIIRPPE